MHLRVERRLRRTANVETWALKRLGNVQRPRPAITPASQVSGLMTFSTEEIHSRAGNDNTRPQSDTVQQNVLSNKEKCHRGNVSAWHRRCQTRLLPHSLLWDETWKKPSMIWCRNQENNRIWDNFWIWSTLVSWESDHSLHMKSQDTV